MKKKYIISFLLTLLIMVPAFVSAQLTTPGGTGLPDASVTEIITNIMQWLLYIVGIVAVIGFAIAGLLYLTAAGDETRLKQAKSAMVYSIIGIIVALVGIVALRAIKSMLDANKGI